MQFMFIMKATKESEAGLFQPPEVRDAMRRYCEEMDEAGILMLAEGLYPSSRGLRIKASGTQRIVTDGPFAEARDLVAGLWMVEVKSREEAIEWAKRAPMEDGAELEVREVYLAADLEKMLAAEARQASVQGGR